MECDYIETVIECPNMRDAITEINYQKSCGRIFMEASNYETLEMVEAILRTVENVDKYFIDYLMEQLREMRKEINELSDALDFAAKERDRENDKIHDIYKKIQDVLDYVEKKAED